MFIVAIAISAYFIKERFFSPPRMNSCFDSYDRRIDCTTRQLIEGNPTDTGGGARTYEGENGLLATRGLLGTNTPSWDSGYDSVRGQINIGDWNNGQKYTGAYTNEIMYHGGDYGNLFEGETQNNSGSGRTTSGSTTGSGSGRNGSGSGSGSGTGTGSGSGTGSGTGTGTGSSSGQIVAPTLTLSTTTKVSDIIAYGNALLNVANTIKTRLNSTPNRVPTLTTQDISTLGAMYVGETPSTVTFSKLLIAVEKDIETLNSGKIIATNMLREGKITNNDTFFTAIPKLFPETGTNVNTLAQSYISGGNNIIQRITNIINIFNRITQALPRPNQPPGRVNPNPGGSQAEADVDSSRNYVDGSGNNVRVSLNALLSAMSIPSFSNDERRRPRREDDDDMRTPQPVKPVDTVSLDQYYSTLKPQIQKDISTAVHDEFARVTAPPNSVPITTPATQQGCSMQEVQQQMQPDMSQYIRKDSIPCWGCSGL